MPAAIRTHALSRDFGSVHALAGLDLEVPTGSIFGFLGPNGAGKTTTIRLLLGLLEATSGSAEILGLDVRTAADRIRAQTGALLEHPGVYERLTAARNLEYYGRIYRLPRAERQARAAELLERFDLTDARNRRASTFSRGMKQKLAIARAMLHRPKLLFLDEPTAGLDPAFAASLREQLLELARREEVTVFLTTHNLDEAERVCDLIGVIRAGRLQAFGPPAELRARAASRTLVEIVARPVQADLVSTLPALPGVRGAQLRTDGVLELELENGGSPAEAVARLVHAGAAVDEVKRVRPSLESVYLELMGAE